MIKMPASVMAAWDMRKHASQHWYSIINTVLIISMIEVALYFFFFEVPWLSYQNSPFNFVVVDANGQERDVDTIRLLPGEIIPLRVQRCNSSGQPRIYPIARELHGGATVVNMESSLASIQPGCATGVSRINRAPMKPGEYWIVGYAQATGFIRTSAVEWRTKKFLVVAAQ